MESLRSYLSRRITETGAPTIPARAMNHLCSRALAAGLVTRAEVGHSFNPRVRNKARMEAALEELWERMPKRAAATVDAYFAENNTQAEGSIPR